LDDFSRIIDDFSTQERIVVIEVHLDEPRRIEQPVIVVRQAEGVSLVPYQIADILASTVGELGAPDPEATVVVQRQAHYPDAGEASSLGSGSAEHVQPTVHPRQVIRLTSQELGERLVFIRSVVVIAELQAVGRVSEVVEELPDSRTGFDEVGQ
jgi:hypothetical protein